jgi:putative ABC transport system permease protein
MGIPVLAGERCLRRRNGGVQDIVINRLFARRYLGGMNPIGLNLKSPNGTGRIGAVVGDAREYALDREPVPTAYSCGTAIAYPPLSFLLRTKGEPAALASAVRRKIKEIAPLRSVYDVAPLDRRIGAEYAEDRLRMALLAFFAGTRRSRSLASAYTAS